MPPDTDERLRSVIDARTVEQRTLLQTQLRLAGWTAPKPEVPV